MCHAHYDAWTFDGNEPLPCNLLPEVAAQTDTRPSRATLASKKQHPTSTVRNPQSLSSSNSPKQCCVGRDARRRKDLVAEVLSTSRAPGDTPIRRPTTRLKCPPAKLPQRNTQPFIQMASRTTLRSLHMNEAIFLSMNYWYLTEPIVLMRWGGIASLACNRPAVTHILP